MPSSLVLLEASAKYSSWQWQDRRWAQFIVVVDNPASQVAISACSIQLRYSQNAATIRLLSSPCWTCADLNELVCSTQSIRGRHTPLSLTAMPGISRLPLMRRHRLQRSSDGARTWQPACASIAHRIKSSDSGVCIDHTRQILHRLAHTP